MLGRRVDKENARTLSPAKSKKLDACAFSNRGISHGWLPHVFDACPTPAPFLQLWCLQSIVLPGESCESIDKRIPRSPSRRSIVFI